MPLSCIPSIFLFEEGMELLISLPPLLESRVRANHQVDPAAQGSCESQIASKIEFHVPQVVMMGTM